MLSLLIYIFGFLVILFLCYKLANLYKKEKNAFVGYFLALMITFGVSEFLGIMLTALAIFTDQLTYLYWLDALTRVIYFIATAIVVQIPLYLYYPKSKLRYWASAIVLIVGLGLFVFNLTLSYQPQIELGGYIEWNAPIMLSSLMAATLFPAWLLATYIFIRQYILDQYKSPKPLYFGLGFFLTITGAILQDFASTNLEFIFIYLSMIIGGLLIFLGFNTGRGLEKKQSGRR